MPRARSPYLALALDHGSFLPLEPRTLLASIATFTDVDGDQFTVKLTGPGTANVSLSAGATGFIGELELGGTTAASALAISVAPGGPGNGCVQIASMNGGLLKSFIAPAASDFVFRVIV